MQGNYGSRFLDMWRTGQALADGTDAGIRNAKELWAQKLAGFAEHPERIGRALQSLPPHPPTLPEFIALCRQQHADMPTGLPAPRMSADEIEPRIAEAAAKVAGERHDHKAWAKRIKAMYLRRQTLLPCQVRLASEALGEVWENGQCRAVEREDVAA